MGDTCSWRVLLLSGHWAETVMLFRLLNVSLKRVVGAGLRGRGGKLAMRREHSYHHDRQKAPMHPRVCGTRSDDGRWSNSELLAKTSCRLFVCQHFIQPREAGPRRGSHIHYVRMSRKDRIRWVHGSSSQLPHFHAINHHGPGTA